MVGRFVLLLERRHFFVEDFLPSLLCFYHSGFQIELLVLLGELVYENGVFDPLNLRYRFLLHVVDLLLFKRLG